MATIRLRARDGHELDAYLAEPTETVRGGIVVGQEMYGVNDYLRSVCDDYAAQGYLAIAPALYHRREPGLVFGYTKAEHGEAQQASRSMDIEASLDDLDAAREAVAGAGKVGVVGFCWGGSLAWLGACRRTYDAAVAYYGALMLDHAEEQARCPVIAHVGEQDNALPLDRVREFAAVQPSVLVHTYPGALHGFDNAGREERYNADAHRLARERTLEFLGQHIG